MIINTSLVYSVDDWECQQDKWTVTELALKHLQEAASEKFPGGKYKLMLFHFFSLHLSHTLSTYFIINGSSLQKRKFCLAGPGIYNFDQISAS